MTLHATQPHGQGGAAARDTNGRALHPDSTTNRPARQAPAANLAHALRYALAGWRVLPLVPGGKTPAIPAAHPVGDPARGSCRGECGRPGHGVHDASSDPEQIGAWWDEYPSANIGLALGDDFVCFDVDPRNGGTIDALPRLGLDPSETVTQRTAGGGWHVLYQKPRALSLAGKVPGVTGIDVLTGARYIVAAPSEVNGKPYRWERDPLDVDPARIPLDLAERLAKRAPAARTDAQNGPTAAQSATPGQYDAATVKSMLDVLNPWQFDYAGWLSCLMAVHSALGDDGLALAERWADGKPGEVAGKWDTFDAGGNSKGKVTVATLLYHARAAGWQPPTAADEADLPPAWRITAEDWRSCPVCAALYTDRMSDGSVSTHHKWCRRPACPVYRKVKARDALRPVFGWPGVQTETVPAADWRRWRKAANLAHGDNWRAVPLPDGARLALFAVDAGGLDVDRVLDLAVGAILENEAARRDRRRARAFLESLPVDEPLAPAQLEAMKQALDVLAQPAGGNVSRPRRKRSDGPALEAQPPAPRAKPVETILVSSFRQRRAVLDVLNRLNIPWERRAYGGWATEPLDPGQLVQLKTALAFGVPGARVLSGALAAGSYAELSTDPPPPALFVTARDARIANLRHGRRALKTEAVPIY